MHPTEASCAQGTMDDEVGETVGSAFASHELNFPMRCARIFFNRSQVRGVVHGHGIIALDRSISVAGTPFAG